MQVEDGFGDEPFDRCMVTTLGSSPHAAAKLYTWDGERWVEYDRLTGCMIVEVAGLVEIQGVSDRLMTDVGVLAEDALTTWLVDPSKECATCG